MKPLPICFLSGGLFGAGLALSGMTDPQRVTAFLDVSGDWDATLAFVMGGAVLVFGGGRLLLRKRFALPAYDSEPLTKQIVVGAIVFGIGWGLGGLCPGPALANLGALRIESLLFVPAMVVGMVLAQRIFGLDR